jgi:peptide/nickel transport system permease protein
VRIRAWSFCTRYHFRVSRAGRRFVANRAAVVGAVLAIALVVVGLFVPHGDPTTVNLESGLSEIGAPLPPSCSAPLGTDHLGRDVWARVADGAKTSLGIAAAATLISIVIGMCVGLAAGYAGGWVDGLLMRVVDLFVAFPFLLLAILLAAVLRTSGLASSSAPAIVALGVVGWPTLARVVRGKAMSIARSEYVTAARGIGAGRFRIVTRHVLPNIAGVVIVLAALDFTWNLLAESALAYLGLGVPPPAPTWGRMLFEGREYYQAAPWLVLVPALAIVIAVAAFQLVADGLRDALDPKGASR